MKSLENCKYFSGKELYGDNFSLFQIEQWYKEEAEAYANMGASNKTAYRYQYHSQNIYYGYKFLDKNKYFHNVCCFGGAYGDELFPIINQIKKVTIVEASN